VKIKALYDYANLKYELWCKAFIYDLNIFVIYYN
jgi:hypothetical protein